MTMLASAQREETNPWDTWNRARIYEHTWMAERAVRLSWNKNYFLDLGMGYGRDSRYMLENGFEEGVGVDKYALPPEISKKFCTSRFSFVKSTIEAFEIPSDTFGAVVASNSLYYCEKGSLEHIFAKVHNGLCSGGIFIANLLDVSDPFAKEPPGAQVSLVSEVETMRLTRDFTILVYRKHIVTNWKQWHNHYLVLEKI